MIKYIFQILHAAPVTPLLLYLCSKDNSVVCANQNRGLILTHSRAQKKNKKPTNKQKINYNKPSCTSLFINHVSCVVRNFSLSPSSSNLFASKCGFISLICRHTIMVVAQTPSDVFCISWLYVNMQSLLCMQCRMCIFHSRLRVLCTLYICQRLYL